MHEPSAFAPHQTLAATLFERTVSDTTDGSHDRSHILRVWQNVRRICAVEGGDLTILVAATILHDCVEVPKDSPERALASGMAADKAIAILTDIGWPQDRITKVAHAIHAHSFSANVTPTTLEAQILQDADRLDAIGHIGIARCFYVSGRLGRAIYDANDPSAQARDLDDTAYALDHFHTKLLRLADGFHTATGQILAAARHETMRHFVDGLLNDP